MQEYLLRTEINEKGHINTRPIIISYPVPKLLVAKKIKTGAFKRIVLL
jgi:hypothetical protein